MNIIQLLFHAINIVDWAWVLKLFFLCLNASIELDKVMISGNALKAWFEISSSQENLGFVKEGRNEGIDEAICEFDRICSVNNDGEYNMAAKFVEYAVSGVLYLFERSLFQFGVWGDLSMMLFDFVPYLEKLFIDITISGLAQN